MRFVGLEAKEPMTPRILIIAYGNPLCSDDGIAWHAADLLRERFSPDKAEIICVHQLIPELAESVSQAQGAIFLDAGQIGVPGEICQARVAQGTEVLFGTHMLTPAQLMTLSHVLYGNSPNAYEVSVTGESFAHGEQLSRKVKSALPQLIEVIDRIAQQICGTQPCSRTGIV